MPVDQGNTKHRGPSKRQPIQSHITSPHKLSVPLSDHRGSYDYEDEYDSSYYAPEPQYHNNQHYQFQQPPYGYAPQRMQTPQPHYHQQAYQPDPYYQQPHPNGPKIKVLPPFYDEYANYPPANRPMAEQRRPAPINRAFSYEYENPALHQLKPVLHRGGTYDNIQNPPQSNRAQPNYPHLGNPMFHIDSANSFNIDASPKFQPHSKLAFQHEPQYYGEDHNAEVGSHSNSSSGKGSQNRKYGNTTSTKDYKSTHHDQPESTSVPKKGGRNF